MFATLRLRVCFAWFFGLIWLSMGAGQAQTKRPALVPDQFDQRIKQLMKSANIPGLSIAVIRNGKLAYSKAYGLTRIDSTQRVTTTTVFEAASLTKPTFAYAVLQLVDEGVLNLDKPLFEYLPYPDVAADERYKKITARMVLSHRSGFPNWRKNRASHELSMLFTPGERFSYSGEGFVYLQKVVEKITGKPINDIMEARVLKPLAMTHSGFIWKSAFDATVAQPHDESGNREQKFKPEQANMAYSLHTTAEDYARFIQAIFTHKDLKASTVDQMLSPQSQLQRRFSGTDTLSTTLFWGLGFGLERMPTATYFWHWGDNGAFKCYITADPLQKDAVVYFANSSNGLDIAEPILQLTMGGQHPALQFLGIDAQEVARSHAKK